MTFSMLLEMGVRVTTENRKLGIVLKQRRAMMSLTLQELAHAASVSPSHLGRIERGERFPSARVLRRLAKPLGLEEVELFTLAEYMSSQRQSDRGVKALTHQLDPYVAAVLSQEPIEIQRAIVGILYVTKTVANSMCRHEEANANKRGTTDNVVPHT